MVVKRYGVTQPQVIRLRCAQDDTFVAGERGKAVHWAGDDIFMTMNLQNEELVTIARFLEPVNAQMAKGVLDSAGIESFLQGENANSMMAFAFRVRLQVQQKDEEAARELLASSVDSIGDQWDTNEDAI